MVDEVKLNVDIRKDLSGHRINELRQNGKLPAIVYGPDFENAPIIIDEKEFKEAISTEHGENVLIKLKIGAKRSVTTIIKEIQVHPVTNKIIHIDLFQINLTQEIEVEVPLEVEGESPGVKNEGGVLDHIVRNVKVKCLPADIPDKFVLDVSALNIGDSLKIKDILKIKGVQIFDDEELITVNVVQPTEYVEPEEEVEKGEIEPEIVGKKKEEGAPAEEKTDAKPDVKPDSNKKE